LCDRIAIMDGGRVIACDTPIGLIRSLNLEAVVSATVLSSSTPLTEQTLGAIAGVSEVSISGQNGNTQLKLHTSDAQASIVGLLSLANETGTTLGDLASTRANLENVFLSLTGRSYLQTDEPAAEAPPEPKRRRRGRSAT
ncbi:MAG: hypothetical protein WKF81_14280, partial [Thermomicrobiales bacterium]